MTSNDQFDRYNKILEGQPIESKLWDSMIEHLNSEIVSSAAVSLTKLESWIRSTFMYQRMIKNPQPYFQGKLVSAEVVDGVMTRKLQASVEELENNVQQHTDHTHSPCICFARRWLCFIGSIFFGFSFHFSFPLCCCSV